MTKEEEIDLAWSRYEATRGNYAILIRAEWLAQRHVEQGGKCKYCEIVTKIPDYGEVVPPTIRATLDHVVAKSVGGPDVFENTVCACMTCNSLKGNGTVDMLFSNPRFRARVLELEAERAS